MFVRAVGNTAVMASKAVQSQAQFRLLNASAVVYKEKTMADKAKEGAEVLSQKGKEIYEKGKKAINDPVKTTADAYHDLVHEVKKEAEKVKDKMSANECGRATDDSYSDDIRGSQKHIDKQIKENEKQFSKVDKKLGGSGKSDVKGGYDPKTQ